MTKARGNTKVILEKVGQIQDLVGNALGDHENDRDTDAHGRVTEGLNRALELCLDIRDMYDPL